MMAATVAAAPGLQIAFWVWAAVLGGLAGYEFPVANRIYLAGRPAGTRPAGVVYAVDLAGSCAAALLVGER